MLKSAVDSGKRFSIRKHCRVAGCNHRKGRSQKKQNETGRLHGHGSLIPRFRTEDVVVDDSKRRLGVGSSLIKGLIKIAKEKGCYKVILNCSDKNIPFYSKFGFLKIDNGMKLVL